MESPHAAENFETEFQAAVAAIDAGDLDALTKYLAKSPGLVSRRLETPGPWLRDQIGEALDGFFARPYLLWFVAEDPVRRGKLPANIATVAKCLIDVARRHNVASLPEQLDYALRLVCWSSIARECGAQIGLIDTLLDAGATLDGHTVYSGRYGTHGDSAIYNRNLAAAEHLIARGADVTLTMALCLNRAADIERLSAAATLEQWEDAFVQAALLGNATALERGLKRGLSPMTVSRRNLSHATALHHAVWSGEISAVRVLLETGDQPADLSQRDTCHHGTPLDWAEYAQSQAEEPAKRAPYEQIVSYLRSKVR